MKGFFFCLLLSPIHSFAQIAANGTTIARTVSASINGIIYKKDGKFGIKHGKDSVTIKAILTRQIDGEYGTFIISKRGYRYPIDEVAKNFAYAFTRSDGIERDTFTTSTGYRIGIGQKVNLGIGSNPDGSFKFIRINPASVCRYDSINIDKRVANTTNAPGANYAGMEFDVQRIGWRKIADCGDVAYLIIYSTGTGPGKFEIDIERALEFGEVEVPTQYMSK